MSDYFYVDFIFASSYNEKIFDAIPVTKMRTLIAVRRDYPGIEPLLDYALTREQVLCRSYEKELDGEILSPMKKIGFITTDISTGFRSRLDELADGNYALSNVSIHNIRHFGMNYCMMKVGLGATLTNDIDVSTNLFDDENIIYFALKNPKSLQTVYAVYRKGEELSEPVQSFINLFSDVVTEFTLKNTAEPLE